MKNVNRKKFLTKKKTMKMILHEIQLNLLTWKNNLGSLLRCLYKVICRESLGRAWFHAENMGESAFHNITSLCFFDISDTWLKFLLASWKNFVVEYFHYKFFPNNLRKSFSAPPPTNECVSKLPSLCKRE